MLPSPITRGREIFTVVIKIVQILFLSLCLDFVVDDLIDFISSIFSPHNCFVIIITNHIILFSA